MKKKLKINTDHSHITWDNVDSDFGRTITMEDFEQEFEVCKGCGTGVVEHLGEDGIAFCPECETIVEGYTEVITESELEEREG